MAADEEWVTWPEAAAIVGCPVPTIDWHSRLGHIEKRPHRGSLPTLKKSSVLAFATWYRQRDDERRDRQLQRKQQREQQRRHPRAARAPQPPAETGWTSTRDSAALLGVNPGHIAWLIRRGHLEGLRVRGRWWVRAKSLEDLVRHREAEAEWISAAEAAALVGCSPGTILHAAEGGELVQRDVERQRPSISRESVRRFRRVWAEREAEREARRCQPKPRPASEPPDDGHEWLTTSQAAQRLGLSVSRVNQLARLELIPSARRASRHWYREDHLALYLNARTAGPAYGAT